MPFRRQRSFRPSFRSAAKRFGPSPFQKAAAAAGNRQGSDPEIVQDEFIPEQGISSIAPGQDLRRSTERLTRTSPEAEARTRSLIGAMQQFLDPTLSATQNRGIASIGKQAGLRGIFGGVVGNAQRRTAERFTAGNRLSGLQGLLQDFTGFAPRGVSAADQTPGFDVHPLLAQFSGLASQFQLGGQAGTDAVNQLNPNLVGGFNNDITGIRDQLFPEGMQGLARIGALPFAAAGGSTIPATLSRDPGQARQTAEQLFSPLMFR